MSELRDWMQSHIGGLREDRDTESYALEFLKTSLANAHAQRSIFELQSLESSIKCARLAGERVSDAYADLLESRAKLVPLYFHENKRPDKPHGSPA